MSTVKDNTADPDDRELAIFLLGTLLENGNSDSGAALADLARDGLEPWAKLATETLVRTDRDGVYRNLFRLKAREGNLSAIQALGYWNDSDNKELLEELKLRAQTNAPAEGEVGRLARQSLEELAILASSDWAITVKSILADSRSANAMWFDWALRVGAQKSMPGLTDVLRVRLDEAAAQYRDFVSGYYNLAPGTDISKLDSYSRGFAESFIIAQVDRFFDDSLIRYAALGGTLKDQEKARLQALGYLGDPKPRLEQLLASD